MTTDLNKRSLRTRRKKTMNSFYYNSDYSNDLNSEESKSRLNFSKKSDTSSKSKDQQRKYPELYNNKELSNSSTMNDINGDSLITLDKKNECSEENNFNDFNDEDALRRIRNNKFNEELINIKNEVKMENSVKLDKSKSYPNVNMPNKSGCNRVKSVPNNNENNYAKMAEKLPHVVGVRFDKSQNRWLSGICINGRCINRYFPVYKYGFEEARRLAIQHRKNFETANLGHLKKQQGESKTSHLNLLNINSQIPNGFKDIQGKNKLIFKYLSYDSVQKEWVVTYDYDNKVLVNKFPVDIYGYNNAYEMAVHCINKLNICNQEKLCKSINNKNENGKNFKGDIKYLNSQNTLNEQDKCFSMNKDKLSKLVYSNSADFLINNKSDSRNEENNNSMDYNVDSKHKSLIDIEHLNKLDKSFLSDSVNVFRSDSSFINNDIVLLNNVKRLNTNSVNNDDDDMLQNNKNIKGNIYSHLKKELNETYPILNDRNFEKLEKDEIVSLDNKNFMNENTKNNLLQNSINYNNFKKCNDDNLNAQQILNDTFVNEDDKNTHILNNPIKNNDINKSFDTFFNSNNENTEQKDCKSSHISYNKYEENNNTNNNNTNKNSSNGISGIGEEYYDSINYEGYVNYNNKIKSNCVNIDEKEKFNNKINILEHSNNQEEFNSYETVKTEKEKKDFLLNENKNEDATNNKTNENLNLENILKFKKMIRNILNNNSADNNEKIIKGINILKNMTMNDKLNLINFNKICTNYSLNNVIKKDENYANNIQKNIKMNYEESINYDEYIVVKNENEDILNNIEEIKKAEKNKDELNNKNGEVHENNESINNLNGVEENNENIHKLSDTNESNEKNNDEVDDNNNISNSNESNETVNKLNSEFNDIAFKLCPWKKGIQWNHLKNMWICKLWDTTGNEITKHVHILKKEGIEIGYNYCFKIRRNSFIYYLTKELKKFPCIEEISYDLQYLHFIIEYKGNEKNIFSFEGGIYKSFIECVEYLNKKKREYNENIYDISNFIKEKNNLELDDIYKELDYFQYNKNFLNNVCEQTKIAYGLKPWMKGIIWEEKMKKWIVFFKDKNKNLRISFFNPSDYNNDVILSYNKCCEYFAQIKESNNFDENTEEFSESIRNFIKNIEFDKIIEQNKNDTINDVQKSSYSCFNNTDGNIQNNDDIKTNGENKSEVNINNNNEKSVFEKNNNMDENSSKENYQNLSSIENRSFNLNNMESNKFNTFNLLGEDLSLLNSNEKRINSGINCKYSLGKMEENFANGNSSSNMLHHNEFYNNMSSTKYDEKSKENDVKMVQEENKKYLGLDENGISKNNRIIDENNQILNNEYISEENGFKIGFSELEKQRKVNINDSVYSNNFFVEDGNSMPRDVKKDKKCEQDFLGGNNGDLNNNMNGTSNDNGNSSTLKPSDIPGNIVYNKNTENGKVLRNYEKCVSMDNRSINKSSEKMDNLLDNSVNIRLPKSEILNQAASLPKLQGMFFDKRRNYWTVSVCGFRKSFGVRTRGVYQAYKLAAEFRNRILETNKGKCYPQKNVSMSGNYKYNLKNNMLKEEKSSCINDGNIEDNYKKKSASSGNIGNEKDLYACNEKRGSFNIKGKMSSNIYDYILDKKSNATTNNNNFMKKDMNGTSNTMSYDDNYGDMEDGKMGFNLKSNKNHEKRSKSNYMPSKYENSIDGNMIQFLNEGDIKDNKNNPFKKNNISSSNSAISNNGMNTNYSPTHIYEVDNLHNSQDYYTKNEDTKNDLSRTEDYKNKNNSPNSFIKNSMHDENKINLNNILENDKLYKTTTYVENCNDLYSKNLNNSDFDNINNKSMNEGSLRNKLNPPNFEENMNFTYSNNISPSEDYYENNKEDLYKTYNYESENKSYNYNTMIDETIEERDIRINKEVNKCKFVDGLIYDEANKCFRIKINGYRKAYSVIRRGVKEAYKLSIEAIHQIRRQTKMNNYNNSENSQINSNNLTHFYNSSSENSRHGSLYNYQFKNKTDVNNECTEDIYDNSNDNNNNNNNNINNNSNNNNNNKNGCATENKQNIEESIFPILNVDDKYYDLLKTAIMICLNDILMNSIPKVFQLYKNLNMADNVKLEDILNNERKRKEQSLKYHIEYTQNSIGISSLIPYLKLFSTEILNNILPSAQSLEIQRLIIHSLDLQAYNTLY